MPLMTCRDCGTDVSTRADACPRCGAPMRDVSVALGGHVVVEQTGRRWKAMKIKGAFCLFVGLLLCVTPLLPVGAILSLVGCGLLLWSRFGAWWYNG